jgi:hypothetical protein
VIARAIQELSVQKNKTTSSKVETICFTRAQAEGWMLPPFQRPLKINQKVRDVATVIGNDGGVVPGVLTFGVHEKITYLIDGQHRRGALLLTELHEFYADTRTIYFDDMADMAQEYVNLQSHLVALKPDDILRGLECSIPPLQAIRKKCKFVGYGYLRSGDNSPRLSMSVLLRAWATSYPEVPARGSTGGSITQLARSLTDEDAEQVTKFLGMADTAWGNADEYTRLWGSLNLTLCMWLYRRIVLAAYSAKTKRIDDAQFLKCLMSLSADSTYCDWLVGRNIGERDRSPAYNKIRNVFAGRLLLDTGVKHQMPRPDWSH